MRDSVNLLGSTKLTDHQHDQDVRDVLPTWEYLSPDGAAALVILVSR